MQTCTKCVMDESDPDITFDEQGVCSWCHKVGYPESKEGLNELLQKVRWSREGKYNCVIGLSGGVDSSFLAHSVVRWGLRPYAITVNCAWVTTEAEHNIKAMSKAIAEPKVLQLCTDFLDLQLAYLKAGVLNLDAPQDHAIIAALWRAAADNGIKYILTGHNQVTESIHPSAWGFPCMDLVNMKAIHKEFGNGRTEKAIPTLSPMRQSYYTLAKGIRVLNPLDYIPYNKEQAKEILKKEYGWQDYGAKHHESIFTRWYQSYILPTKYGIDKRRSHLSALILSGQTTRDEALAELEKPACSEEQIAEDRKYIMRALGADTLEQAHRDHREFATDPWWVRYLQYATWRLS